MDENSRTPSPMAGLSAAPRCTGLALLLAGALVLHGCAVVSVADAAVSVASTAVKVTATVVETTVDVAASGVKAVTSEGSQGEGPKEPSAEPGRQ